MLGAKTFCSLLALATAAVASSCVSAEQPPAFRGANANPALDAAIQNLAQMEQFEAAVTDLALHYGIPLEDSKAASDQVKMATDAAANDRRIISGALNQAQGKASLLASRCTLSANASDTKKLNLACTSNKIRFIGIGDWGEKATNAGLTAVRDGILSEANSIDFILNAGDSFYTYGVSSTKDTQWTNTWLNRYSVGTKLTVPWFSILGNHDHYGNSNSQIEYSKATQPGSKYWIMPGEFYSVDITDASGKKLKLVNTDTITIKDADYTWVAKELSDASSEFAIVMGHYHIFSAGGRGDTTDSQVKRLDTVIKANPKAKAYICGHEHDMQYLQSGAVDYFLIGGGGRGIDFSQSSPGTAASIKYYQRNYGYAVYDVDIAARQMNVTYNIFNKNGAKVESKVFTRQY